MTTSLAPVLRRLRQRGGAALVASTTGLALLGPALLATPAGAAAPPQVQEAAPAVDVVDDVEIPTRSGHVLRGDLYRPVVAGVPVDGLPTVVTYFPYVKDDDRRFEVTAMRRFAQAGFAGLLVDIPGTGASIGEFGFFSDREIADGRDAVDWAAAQPFSNGRVGLWGYSYPGITAARIAATRPPSLRAVVPASIFNDAYRDVVAPGGILATQDAALIPFVAGQAAARPRQGTDPAVAFEELLNTATTPGNVLIVAEAATHTSYDEYWQERALDGEVEKIEVPALLWGGWSDVYPRGTLLNHAAIGSRYKRLVMGPWGHLAGVAGEPFELFLQESLTWFDTFLRQDPDPARAQAATGTRLFDMDWSGTADTFAGTWPGRFADTAAGLPTTTQRSLVLCSGDGTPDAAAPWPVQGRLGADCPAAGSLPVVHVPVDATGGGSIAHDAFANPYANELWDDKDQRASLASTALLSEPLEVATTITGGMTVDLAVSTLGTDADWIVRVVDVGPDRTRVLAPGWLRASRRHEDPDRTYLRHTHDRDEPVTPGEPYRLRVEVWPTSYTVPAGHRLGLLVRTADSAKVTPGASPGLSSVLTGPGAVSTLSFSVRSAASGSAAPPAGSPAGTPPADAAPGAVRPALPATGPGTSLLLPAGVLALALAAALWRSSTGGPLRRRRPGSLATEDAR